jgi:hypothetical protein
LVEAVLGSESLARDFLAGLPDFGPTTVLLVRENDMVLATANVLASPRISLNVMGWFLPRTKLRRIISFRPVSEAGTYL